MRTFEHFPNKQKCPICKTNEDKTCVLVGIEGTQEGFNVQAQPFHLECLDLTWFKDNNIIAMKWLEEKADKKEVKLFCVDCKTELEPFDDDTGKETPRCQECHDKMVEASDIEENVKTNG